AGQLRPERVVREVGREALRAGSQVAAAWVVVLGVRVLPAGAVSGLRHESQERVEPVVAGGHLPSGPGPVLRKPGVPDPGVVLVGGPVQPVGEASREGRWLLTL